VAPPALRPPAPPPPLAAHGRPHEAEATTGPAGEALEPAKVQGNGTALDITRTYVKQQARSRFIVMGA
jgi:hypothetical protein